MHEEENYFCSLSGSKPSKIPRFDYGMQSRDHFLLQTLAHHQQQQQQHLLQHHRRSESQSSQQQQLKQEKQHHQRSEMLPQEIIHVPIGPIHFQENIDWKSNIVYQAPPLEQWNPNLIGKVDSIWRTYLISLGKLQYKGFYLFYLFVTLKECFFSKMLLKCVAYCLEIFFLKYFF
jgi:hypothetical protein